jgi:hypothetical protein
MNSDSGVGTRLVNANTIIAGSSSKKANRVVNTTYNGLLSQNSTTQNASNANIGPSPNMNFFSSL